MSALASPTALGGRRLRPRLSGLTWLIWRQNRTAFWIGLAAAAAVAVYAAVQHQHAAAAAAAQHLDACHGRETSAACLKSLLAFEKEHQFPLRRPLQAMVLLPFLFGLFLGGPQLAQELESGTYRTVTTQSVTRTHWIVAKIGVPLAVTAFVSSVFAAAMTWWWHPVAAALGPLFPWQGWYPFYGVGPVVVGLSVLLYLLGATLGLVLRRTVLAMGATLAAGAGLFALLEQVRPYLWPVRTVSAQHTSEPPAPGGSWLLQDGPLSTDGRHVSEVTDCYAQSDFRRCLTEHGITGHWARYHPVTDLWPLQWTAMGLCVTLGVALVALSVWWIRKHPS
ncbi:ABC transporter permease [Streptomyces sp. NPDC005122]